MNQILVKKIKKTKKINISFFKSQLFSSILLVCLSLSYYMYNNLKIQKNEKTSQKLISNFNEYLYNQNTINKNINVSTVSTDKKEEFPIIGIIEIKKLNISYPVLASINDEHLKISPCKFYGPFLNEIGNVCIAGHNYNDDRFFSKINTLENGDIVSLTDTLGKKIEYVVYAEYEVYFNDTSCTNQNTNNLKELTLITCNNSNGNRIVIKCREK